MSQGNWGDGSGGWGGPGGGGGGQPPSGGGYGPFMDIIVGVVGALAGGFIMSHLGFAGQGGLIYTIIVAVIGAIILTLLLRLVTRGRVRSI